MAGALEELSLEGFQVVKSEMFLHLPRKGEPTCSLWPYRVSFNKISLQVLNSCEYVRLEINPNTKGMLVVPVSSKDKAAIRWIKGQKDYSVRNMESKAFGSELYKAWELNPEFNYRATGKLVSSKGKVMLLFDFNGAELWKSKVGEANDE